MSSKSQRTIYSGFLGLPLLLKERKIKIAISDMNKENTEKVDSFGYRTCVSLQQHFLALTKQHFGFGVEFQAAFVFSGIHVFFSACPKLWLCCQSSLQFMLTSSILLSKREISCPNFLILLLLGILEEPTRTLFIVLKVSSY